MCILEIDMYRRSERYYCDTSTENSGYSGSLGNHRIY